MADFEQPPGAMKEASVPPYWNRRASLLDFEQPPAGMKEASMPPYWPISLEGQMCEESAPSKDAATPLLAADGKVVTEYSETLACHGEAL